ncbi:MAG: hypothetical protein II062_07600 [Oscillospiraceae bacterium]|nr:hypothetical protein [Oscillospiraceae bacterium]MBR7009649.1 hypothetical protein [Oscillospiraceae bacterium]
MPDQSISAGRPAPEAREAVRIHTRQIQDACIDKDCIEDLRVWLTEGSQTALESAVNARARSAELLHVYIDVAPIAYKPGHFTADLSFFYRITGEAMSGLTRPAALEGLAVFSKRVVLYGGQSQTKVFSSADNELLPDALYRTRVPDCLVEAVDPMVLSSRVGEGSEGPGQTVPEIPQAVRALFPEEPVLSGTRLLYVTLGQFSTVRMERETQLLIPASACAMPDRSCSDDPGTPDEPCDLFAKVDFPTQAFYPD